MNTRRYPRTLQEAFGPYTSREVLPMPEPRDYSAAWWWAMCVIALVTLYLIFHP